MSTAREIAEERFAKGEISEEEFQSIVSSLTQSPTPSRTPTPTPTPETATTAGFGTQILQIIGGGIAVLLVIGFFSRDDSVSGLEKVNVMNHGHKVTFDIANTGSKSGDVLVYVKSENGSERCIHVFNMHPGTIKDLSVPCESTSGGEEVYVYTRWVGSNSDKGLVRLATRINLDWKK